MSNVGNIWNNSYTNDYSYLFNNLSTSTSNSTKTNNILGIDLAEYSSITRGSYNKLVKAYYEKYNSGNSSDTKDSKSDTVAKTTLKGNANELYDAASALVTNGKDSVFAKVETKDKDGNAVKDYDKDKIFEAVSSMVEAYNGLVEKSTDSNSNAVLRQTLHMINSVSSNGELLADVGIKIGADNKLTVDEDAFKDADMNTVKTLFNGNSSLGGKIQGSASNIYMNVNNSLGDSNFYTSSGTLGNYSTGNILDSLM